MTDAIQPQRPAEIRKARALNQKILAERMRVSQAGVNESEHGTAGTAALGTPESYVEALAGTLRVVAECG